MIVPTIVPSSGRLYQNGIVITTVCAFLFGERSFEENVTLSKRLYLAVVMSSGAAQGVDYVSVADLQARSFVGLGAHM